MILTGNKADQTGQPMLTRLQRRLINLMVVLLLIGIADEGRADNLLIPLPPRRPASLGPSATTPPPATVTVQPTVKPAPVTLTPMTPAPSELSADELLTAINDQLTALTQFSAKFSQTSGNGQLSTGKLTVYRPGRLRFDYNPPSAITIIADGNSVAVIDSRLGTQDVYSIGLTPLKFLLGSTINLARDFKILDVSREGDETTVYGEDSSTFGGTSRIALGFDAKTLLLKRWTVTDPQGYEVRVTLTNIDIRHEPDPALFVIPIQTNSHTKK